MSKHKKDVQEHILQAAEQLFAERGFRGTSLRKITEAAGCNLAAVSYHFHGKEKLYIAVFQRHMKVVTTERFLGLQDAFAKNPNALTLEGFLRTLAEVFVSPFLTQEHDQLSSRLMLQERQDPHLPNQMFYNEVVAPLHDALRKTLIALCPFLSTEKANQCLHSLLAQLIYTLHAQVLFAGTDEAEMPLLNMEKTLEHIIQFSAAGIRQYGQRDPERNETN